MCITNYLLAPAGWTHEDPNPFSVDGAYGPQWSCFRIREEPDWVGGDRRCENGLFSFVVGRAWPRSLAVDMADFIRYESMHGRQCIVSVAGDVDARTFVIFFSLATLISMSLSRELRPMTMPS